MAIDRVQRVVSAKRPIRQPLELSIVWVYSPGFSLRFEATTSLTLRSVQHIVCGDFCTDPHPCGLGSSLRDHAQFQPFVWSF
jgi:hypothetical protein